MTGKEYKLSDTLPVNAPDATFVSHYDYLIKRNPAWALGLKRADGRPYYTPANRDKRLEAA